MNINKEEAENARKQGFPNFFRVYEGYKIVDDELLNRPIKKIIRVGEVIRNYFPVNTPNLPNIIARIDHTRENEIMNFIKKYGIFGRANLLPFYDENKNELYREETLEWVQVHIMTVTFVLELMQSVQNSDEDKAMNIINKMSEIGPLKNGNYIKVGIRGQYDNYYHVMSGSALNAAKLSIESIINMNIENIKRKGSYTPKPPFPMEFGDTFKSNYSYKSLIEIVYWQLADIAEGGSLKRCEYCNTPFLNTDERQRFCPHDPTFEKESRCATAYRQKMYRERKKAEKKGIE